MQKIFLIIEDLIFYFQWKLTHYSAKIIIYFFPFIKRNNKLGSKKITEFVSFLI